MIEAILFALLLYIGVPIAFVLGIVSLSHIILSGDTQLLIMIPARLFAGLDNFALLAIPGFMLAGEAMNAGSITTRLVEFGNLVVGRFRGGMAYANVLVSMLLAGCTGAATSEAAAIGSVMIPAMEKSGYDRPFSSALTTTASTLGPIIPPSMPFILYGVVSGVSIGALFFAGVIPGVMCAIALMVVIYILAKRHNYPVFKEKIALRKLMKLLIHVLIALTVPFVILGGIRFGIFTPSEAAAIAGILALFIVGIVYREVGIKTTFEILLKSGMRSASILFIVSAANLFGWILAAHNIPQTLAQVMLNFTSNKVVLILIINAFLLITGTFMESLASIVIMVPILAPAIEQIGIDPVHFGVIYVLNVVIGLNTPPVGVCLYVVSAVASLSLEKLIKAVIPFLIALVIVLLLVSYIPSLSLWLPRLIFH